MNITFKPNTIVVWTTTNITIAAAFCYACQQLLPDYTPTLTSGSDGEHSPDSGHYYGRALDFRSNDMEESVKPKIKDMVDNILGKTYLCLIEPGHFHIQRNKNTF